jgi:hypothetical protein
MPGNLSVAEYSQNKTIARCGGRARSRLLKTQDEVTPFPVRGQERGTFVPGPWGIHLTLVWISAKPNRPESR